MRLIIGILVMMLASTTCHAVQVDEILPNPALELRARDLSSGLRCLVCQNQSIDDSDAPLAKDLRLLVRERLLAGDTDTQVKAFLVDRYGEFILLNPRWGIKTGFLWLFPLLSFALATLCLWRVRSLQRSETPVEHLSEAEKAQLDAVLRRPPD